MPAYRLTAPRNLGKVPKGFILMVASRSTPTPDSKECGDSTKECWIYRFIFLELSFIRQLECRETKVNVGDCA